MTPDAQHHRPGRIRAVAAPTIPHPKENTMRALTVRQPWADAITHGTKRVENRTRPAPAKHHGSRILIHAGAAYDLMGRFFINRDDLADWPDERKALIAVATLVGSHPETNGCCGPWGETGVHHWQLADVVPLARPVPTPGALGFWTPAPDVLAAVADQIGAVR